MPAGAPSRRLSATVAGTRRRPPDVTEEDTAALEAIIAGHEPAASNFRAMSPSVRRTYTRAYFDAKTDAGREKRLAWMLDRLDRNLKPM